MGVIMLSLDSCDKMVLCSKADLRYLKLFVFEDQCAQAIHCSTTHHKGQCPIVTLFIEYLKHKPHRKGI
jgi:hypothetical protein